MANLAISNILHRKTRTVITVSGLALGVALVVLTAGIIGGFLHRQGQRNAAVTAEVMVRTKGATFGLGMGASVAPSIRPELVDQIRLIEGVEVAVPVAQVVDGTDLIDGIDYESFKRVSDARVVEGRPIADPNEVMVDRTFLRSRKLKVGDELTLLNTKFRLVGVYDPESLGRLKIPISTLQRLLNKPGLASMVLVKVNDPSQQVQVASQINDRIPQLTVILTRDLPIIFSRGTPALHTFNRVVFITAVVISVLVTLLSMYSSVVERTRHIGVLKSLGASRLWIAREIEMEALVVSVIGVLAGYVVSYLGKCILEIITPV